MAKDEGWKSGRYALKDALAYLQLMARVSDGEVMMPPFPAVAVSGDRRSLPQLLNRLKQGM